MKQTYKGLNILIIEDSELIQKKLVEILLSDHFANIIWQAKSIQEGLDLLQSQNPDVVILDINLPDGTGMEILTHIKKNKAFIKVIIFSNSSDNYYKRKFFENGCDYFLDKSTDFTKISETILSITNILKSGNNE